MIELDRLNYNNSHKYLRHTSDMPDKEEDNLTPKQQEQQLSEEAPLSTITAENLDKKSCLIKLSDKDQQILDLAEKDYTQKQIAKTLGITQGYVSMARQQAQYNFEYLEYTSALKTNETDYIWKCWNLF